MELFEVNYTDKSHMSHFFMCLSTLFTIFNVYVLMKSWWILILDAE